MPKRAFAVLTDSACDLPPEIAEKYGIDILCFSITVDGKNYTEREDFTFDEYYELLRSCENVPATAQITQFRFFEQFEKYDADGVRQVLYVSINRTGSATHDAAVLARQQFYAQYPDSGMRIFIVDSHTYSIGYGWHVAEAAAKLQNGAEMQGVVEWLEDRFSRLEIILGAYTLRFMKKSGRVSAAAAFAGELLGLRPIISLTDGVSTVESKVRGDAPVIPALLAYADKRMADTKEYMVVGSNEATMQEMAALCKKKWKADPIGLYKVGAAIATNTGPDLIAIIFIGEPRER